MDYPKDKPRKSSVVRIPTGLLESVKDFVGKEEAHRAGYDDYKSFIEDAVRRHLERYGQLGEADVDGS